MTIDKIKHYLGNDLFEYWSEVSHREDAKEKTTNAIKVLSSENRTDIKSIAELTFLNYLIEN